MGDCTSVCASVRLWTLLQGLCKQLQPFLWVQKVTRGHITAHSEGFFKIFIFWPFLAPFLVKIDPKLTFSLNLGAFFSGRVQNGFETQNGFTRSTFRGMPSFVPKFAFLVVENGLRNPTIGEFFKKMGTLLNVGAFFLVGSRTDLRLKMGLILGVLLGVCQVLCRDSHF